ncbi:MAG: enoyl-CoA hydratase-related protein [Pseudomonadota bacterium]
MGSEINHDIVCYEKTGNIATITLNRPESLNAMTGELMSSLSNALAQVTADETVRVVVLTGNGRGFCAGADLSGPAASDDSPDNTDSIDEQDSTAGMNDFFNPAMRALYNCPVPTIARVNGAAAGGGFGLALACDITIAARSAFFVATFGPKLGIVPDLGTTWTLPLRTGRARAMGISLLGERISAEQALAWGLIWNVTDDEQLDDEVGRVASILERASPEAITRIRQSIDAAAHNSFSEQLDLEMRHQGVLIPRNMGEGAAAFMEKRDPVFSGRRE